MRDRHTDEPLERGKGRFRSQLATPGNSEGTLPIKVEIDFCFDVEFNFVTFKFLLEDFLWLQELSNNLGCVVEVEILVRNIGRVDVVYERC